MRWMWTRNICKYCGAVVQCGRGRGARKHHLIHAHAMSFSRSHGYHVRDHYWSRKELEPPKPLPPLTAHQRARLQRNAVSAKIATFQPNHTNQCCQCGAVFKYPHSLVAHCYHTHHIQCNRSGCPDTCPARLYRTARQNRTYY